VGLLTKVTGALAAEGIPVNVISAFYHDYLLVPIESAEAALHVLTDFQDQARATGEDS
jgi:hypothetical protein